MGFSKTCAFNLCLASTQQPFKDILHRLIVTLERKRFYIIRRFFLRFLHNVLFYDKDVSGWVGA